MTHDEDLTRKIEDAILADPTISEEYKSVIRRKRERLYLDKAHRVSKVPEYGEGVQH